MNCTFFFCLSFIVFIFIVTKSTERVLSVKLAYSPLVFLNLYCLIHHPAFTQTDMHSYRPTMLGIGPDGATFVVIHSESIWTHYASLSANLPFWWVSMILCPMKSRAVHPTIAYLSYISAEYSPVKKIKPWCFEIISVSYLLPAEMCRLDALQRAEWLSWTRHLIVWGLPHNSLFFSFIL